MITRLLCVLFTLVVSSTSNANTGSYQPFCPHSPEETKAWLGSLSVAYPNEPWLADLANSPSSEYPQIESIPFAVFTDKSLSDQALEYICVFESLTELHLYQNNLEGNNLELLSSLKNLEVIDLDDNKIRPNNLFRLPRLEKLHQLQLNGMHRSLSNTHKGNDLFGLTWLATFRSLKTLLLWDNNFSDSDLFALLPLIALPKLERIELIGNQIRGEGLQIFSYFPALKALRLMENPLENLSALSHIQLEQLEFGFSSHYRTGECSNKLNLDYTQWYFLSSDAIQYQTISCTNIDNETVVTLLETSPSLQMLNVVGSEQVDEQLLERMLQSSKISTKLTRLQVASTQLYTRENYETLQLLMNDPDQVDDNHILKRFFNAYPNIDKSRFLFPL